MGHRLIAKRRSSSDPQADSQESAHFGCLFRPAFLIGPDELRFMKCQGNSADWRTGRPSAEP
jgi:hypothetical protein